MNKWIPVQKKLPEKEGRYLVTLPLCGDDGNSDGYYVTVARWGKPPKEESTYFYLIFEKDDDDTYAEALDKAKQEVLEKLG